jgi:hypothetical protein
MCGKVFSGVVKAVSSLFGGGRPSTPAPAPIMQAPIPETPAPVAPTVDTQAVQDAAAEERRRRATATGRQSTILAGGLLDAAAPTAGKALLGQ